MLVSLPESEEGEDVDAAAPAHDLLPLSEEELEDVEPPVPLAPAVAQKQKEAAQPLRPQTLLSACFAERVSAASRPENLAAQNANPLRPGCQTGAFFKP